MGDDMPPDDPGVAPPFHDLEVDEDGVATPSGIDTSTEAGDLQERIDRLGIDTLLTGDGVVDRLRLLAGALRRQADRLEAAGGADLVTHFYRASADVADEGADHIERLQSWKNEACEVIEAWEMVWSALGAPGNLGDFKSAATLAAVERLVAERDEARAVLAAVPDDVRRLAEAVVDIEVSGVLPEGWTVSSDDLNPDLLIVSEPEEIRFALEPHDDEWSCEDDTRVTFGPTAVEAVRAALAAAGVEAPAAGTDGGGA